MERLHNYSNEEISQLLKRYFNYKVDEQYTFEKFLVNEMDVLNDEIITDLERILKNKQSYNLIAPLNSGKTYSTIFLGHEKSIPTVVAIPLTALGTQLVDKFNDKNIPILFVHGGDDHSGIPGTSELEIKNYLEDPEAKIIVCVYDSLERLVKHGSFGGFIKHFNLIIDESHNLVTQSNFRYPAILRVLKYHKKFRKTIYLTGTPDMTILNSYPTVEFRKTASDEFQKIVNIITYENSPVYKITCHMFNFNVIGKTVLLVDNKRILTQVKKGLMFFGVPENEIMILSSEEKYSEAFIKMMREEQIPSNKRFLLATRVISDGINLFDEDISSVYFLNATDVLLKRQFIGRFRKKPPVVYDFIEPSYNYFPMIEYLSEREEELKNADRKKCVGLNELPPDSDSHSPYVRNRMTYSLKNNNNTIIFDKLTRFKVSEERHRLSTMEILFSFIHSNEDYLSEYYTTFANARTTINDYDELVKQDLIPNQLSQEDFNLQIDCGDEVDLSNPNHIYLYLEDLLSCFVVQRQKIQSFHKYANTKFLSTILPKDFNKNNSLLFAKEKERFIICLEFLNRGFNLSFIKEYLNLHYATGENNWADLNELREILFLYQDYCGISRLISMRELTIELSCSVLKSNKIIIELMSYGIGEHKITTINESLRRLLRSYKYPKKQRTGTFFLNSVFELENGKSSRHIKLANLNLDYNPTEVFSRIDIFGRFSSHTRDYLFEHWDNLILVGSYYKMVQAQIELPEDHMRFKDLTDFVTELGGMCEGALGWSL